MNDKIFKDKLYNACRKYVIHFRLLGTAGLWGLNSCFLVFREKFNI